MFSVVSVMQSCPVFIQKATRTVGVPGSASGCIGCIPCQPSVYVQYTKESLPEKGECDRQVT
jgi:hypothetical protein